MNTREQNARYYRTHLEKERARGREYYKTHAEHQKAYHRAYYRSMSESARQKKRAHDRAYHKAHPEKSREYYQKSLITNPDKNQRNHYKRLYGISLSEYRALVSKQEGRCLICQETPKRKLYVDHDHATGKIRGLICIGCNSGIGLFKNDPKILFRAIKYLEERG